MIFVLTQTMSITGTISIDNKQQLDSTAALFLAESGLEQARAKIALNKSNCCKYHVTNCPNGFKDTPLGSGNFVFSTPTVSSTGCSVTVEGQVGSARRTISLAFNFAGATAFCNKENISPSDCSNASANLAGTPPVNPTWSLTLPSGAGVGFFNLAAEGAAGISSAYPATSAERWKYSSPSSLPAVLGASYTVSQQGADTSVYQVLNTKSSDAALAGVSFSGGTWLGKYADSSNTVKSGTTSMSGITTDGVPNGWCGAVSNGLVIDGNTLVMGFSAHSNGKARTDGLGSVIFDARDDGSGINMDRKARTPRMPSSGDDPDALASDKVYSEIWYKQNAPFHQGFWITGKLTGATVTLASFNTDNKAWSATLSSSDPSIYKNIQLSVGMQINVSSCVGSNFNAGDFGTGQQAVTITAFDDCSKPPPSGPSSKLAAAGLKICWSTSEPQPKSSGNCAPKAPASTTESVLLVKNEFFQYGSGTASGQSVAGVGVPVNTIIGTALNAVDVPSGYSKGWTLNQPAPPTLDIAMVVDGVTITANEVILPTSHQTFSTTPPQIVSVIPLTILTPGVAGKLLNSGQLPSGTTLTGQRSPVPSGTTAVESVLNGAILCGGTCAFFDHLKTNTTFKLSSSSTLPSGTDAWVAGFACLSGAGAPEAVTGGGKATAGQWHEVIH